MNQAAKFAGRAVVAKFVRVLVAVLVPAACLGAGAEETPKAGSPALMPFVPTAITLPKDADYQMPDGTIRFSGADLSIRYFQKFNALFQKYHPEFKFSGLLKTSSLALAGLVAERTAFGPMTREANFQDIDAFKSRFGYEPLDIQIGWDNNPSPDIIPGGKNPPGIWVNAANPIPPLAVEDIAAIFTTGSGSGDITYWSQLPVHEGPIGVNGGDWAKREINVYMPMLRALPIISTTRYQLGGHPWSPRVQHLPLLEDVLNAVANDKFGIGLAGWWPIDIGWDRQFELGSKVRFLPLRPHHEGKISNGGMGDLYPLTGGFHIMVNRPPGKPLEPWLKEYLRLALSKEGQELMASLMKTDGFLPMAPEEVVKQLAKLD